MVELIKHIFFVEGGPPNKHNLSQDKYQGYLCTKKIYNINGPRPNLTNEQYANEQYANEQYENKQYANEQYANE